MKFLRIDEFPGGSDFGAAIGVVDPYKGLSLVHISDHAKIVDATKWNKASRARASTKIPDSSNEYPIPHIKSVEMKCGMSATHFSG